MSFIWEDYLSTAETLLQIAEGKITCPELNKQEAVLRSALSRAYYATYHRALEYLLDNTDFQLQKYDSHSTVINAYRNSIYRDRKAIFFRFLALKNLRVKADYNLNFDNTKQLALNEFLKIAYDGIVEARTVIKMISNFKPRNNRTI
jgi:uncharacterized protein (UPF0332 family)